MFDPCIKQTEETVVPNRFSTLYDHTRHGVLCSLLTAETLESIGLLCAI